MKRAAIGLIERQICSSVWINDLRILLLSITPRRACGEYNMSEAAQIFGKARWRETTDLEVLSDTCLLNIQTCNGR